MIKMLKNDWMKNLSQKLKLYQGFLGSFSLFPKHTTAYALAMWLNETFAYFHLLRSISTLAFSNWDVTQGSRQQFEHKVEDYIYPSLWVLHFYLSYSLPSNLLMTRNTSAAFSRFILLPRLSIYLLSRALQIPGGNY